MAESSSDGRYHGLGSRVERTLRQAEARARHTQSQAERLLAQARAEADGTRLRTGQCPECLRRERVPLGLLRRRR